jgi:hypothetical protein
MGIQRSVDLVPGGPWTIAADVLRQRGQLAGGKTGQVLRFKEQRTDEIAIPALGPKCLKDARTTDLEGLEEQKLPALGINHDGYGLGIQAASRG